MTKAQQRGLISFMGVATAITGFTWATTTPRLASGVAPYTVKHYTLRGASIDFLLANPQYLKSDLGGNARILENATYGRLRDLSTKFSMKFSEDAFGEGSFSKASEKEGDDGTGKRIPAKTFLGQSFFVGDSHGECGYYPSASASDRQLKQILAAHPAWRFALNYENKEGDVVFWRSADAASLQKASTKEPEQEKIVELARYVTQDKFPPGFFLLYHTITVGGCGDDTTMSDSAVPRYVNLDVAVIENNSSKTLRISDFRGGLNSTTSLRTASVDRKSQSGTSTLPWPSVDALKPGERLVVPLRIAFSMSDYDYASPMSPDDVIKRPQPSMTKAFLADMKAKKKLNFMVYEGEKETKVQMPYSLLARYAKLPWQDPLINIDYIYGTSATLESFKVSDANLTPSRGKSQSIAYTTAGGYGSCPYVYVWDDARSMWINKGRVLVGRVGAAATAEEVYDLDLAPTKVSIREREPEETHLAGIWLEILAPQGSVRVNPTGSGIGVIRQGEEIVAQFDIPPKLRTCATRLHVAGYYLRTPRIQVEDLVGG